MTAAAPTEKRQEFTLSPDEALERAGVEAKSGLASDEVSSRRAKYGPNKFAEAPPDPVWQRFIRQYQDLMQIVLLVAGVVSIWPVEQYSTGILLIGLTILNAAMGMAQEGKAAEAVAALQQMMVVKARVLRGGELVEVPAEELVPGDIVSVEAGDLITADGRLIVATTLENDYSPLTCDSMTGRNEISRIFD